MKRANLFPDETKQNLPQSSTKNQRRSPTSHTVETCWYSPTHSITATHRLALTSGKRSRSHALSPSDSYLATEVGALCAQRALAGAPSAQGEQQRRPAPAGAHLASRAVTIDELPTAHRPNSAPSNRLPSAQRRATFSSTVCPSAKWLSTRALAKGEVIAPALSRCSVSGQRPRPGALKNKKNLSRRPLCLRPHPLPEPILHWRERPASPPEATAISSSDLKADREDKV
eukprot:g82605.t1